MTPAQRRRWQNFQTRVASRPAAAYGLSGGGRYIPIHPFADEADELARLGITPADCWGVDAWWEIKQDATLVQACVAHHAHHPPGLYARRSEDDEGWIDLLAVVDLPAITRVGFEAALSQFVALGFPGGARFDLLRGQGLIRLADFARSPELPG